MLRRRRWYPPASTSATTCSRSAASRPPFTQNVWPVVGNSNSPKWDVWTSLPRMRRASAVQHRSPAAPMGNTYSSPPRAVKGSESLTAFAPVVARRSPLVWRSRSVIRRALPPDLRLRRPSALVSLPDANLWKPGSSASDFTAVLELPQKSVKLLFERENPGRPRWFLTCSGSCYDRRANSGLQQT
jgi:hypothetical protein